MSTCSLQHGASLAARHPRGYSTQYNLHSSSGQPRVSSREPRITSGTSQYFRQVKTPRSSTRAERPPQTPQRTPITTRVPRRSTVWRRPSSAKTRQELLSGLAAPQQFPHRRLVGWFRSLLQRPAWISNRLPPRRGIRAIKGPHFCLSSVSQT